MPNVRAEAEVERGRVNDNEEELLGSVLERLKLNQGREGSEIYNTKVSIDTTRQREKSIFYTHLKYASSFFLPFKKKLQRFA